MEIELATINNPQARPWHSGFAIVSKKRFRQVFGMNPFRTSYFSLYRPMITVKDRFTIALGVVFAVAAGLPLPIIGIIFSRIINQFPPPEDALRTHVCQLIGVGAAYFVVTAVYTIAWGLIGEQISWRLRQDLVKRLLGMDQTYFDLQDPDVTGLLTEKVESIQIGTSEKVGIFIQSISYFISAFVVGFILNPRLTGVLFAAVIPAMLLIVTIGSSAVNRFASQASSFNEQAGKIAEAAIAAVKVVQAFGMADEMEAQYEQYLKGAASYAIKKSTASALMLGAVYFVAYAANGLAFWEGSKMAAGKSKGDAGSVYAVVFLILDASFVLGQFGPFLGAFGTAAAAGEKVFDVLDCEAPAINAYSDEGKEISEHAFEEDIRMEDIGFAYPSRTAFRALEDLNLTIRGRALNAIVGESGSGKSSIISMLLRLYDPSHGSIIIDGQDLRHFNVASLRRHLALVDQDSVLFSGTILDNISHGLDCSALDANEIRMRCEQAALDANVDFLDQLPAGIFTTVGAERGTQLSGGQKQRICLARALVKQPKLLLLDEPTSALDTTSESLVTSAIRKAATRGCTVVMVTHRLASTMDFDNIALMAHGKVLEQGSHSQLMDFDGVYKSMVQAQALASTTKLDTESIFLDRSGGNPDIRRKNLADVKVTTLVSAQSTNDPIETTLSWPAIIVRCTKLTRDKRVLIAIALCLSIISGGIILGEAITFGHVVQLLNSDSGSAGFLGRASFLCLMFFMLAIIALVAYCGTGTAFGVASAHFIAKVQHTSLANILRQDIAWFSTHPAHSLVANLHSDAAQLSCLSGVAIGTIFTVTTSVCGGIILAHIVAWKIAIVLLCAVPVMVLAGYTRLRVLALAETRHRSAYNEAAAIASEACSNMRTVASLAREDGIFQTYRAALKQPYKKGTRFTLVSNVLLALSLSITYFVYALAYWWGSQLVRKGEYTSLQFFIVLPALLFSAQSAGQVFSLSPEISKASIAARNVFRLYDEKPSIMIRPEDLAASTPGSSMLSFVSDKFGSGLDQLGYIRMRDVSLTYADRKRGHALDAIDLDIKPKETIAIVGASGAGKSSVVALLARFYDVSSGSITIDGEDIKHIPASKHRERIGLVPQDPDLFPGSISYNIRLGATAGQTVSEADIRFVCTECGIHDFITSLPEGYNTECGRNGSKLSGGQKQRIAIARALIRRPSILLLDEYISALDAHSELAVRKAVDSAARERTTVIVAHRLSTVQHADRIVVLDQGSIVEIGTHKELIAKEGLYASMAAAQTLS